ncbi:unnamed protein product, partial [Allacma fusca]
LEVSVSGSSLERKLCSRVSSREIISKQVFVKIVMVEYKLRYFNLRGRGEPIRWIFHHTGMEFEDERIEQEDWAEIKSTFTYEQVPVLEFDGKGIFGSQPICRFLARLFGLCGQDDVEAAKCDEYVDAFQDIINAYVSFLKASDEEQKEEIKGELLEKLCPKYFTIYEDVIAQREGGKFLVEEGVTWADLYIAAWLDTFLQMDENILEPFPHLTALREEVRGLPGIKEWLQNRPETLI